MDVSFLFCWRMKKERKKKKKKGIGFVRVSYNTMVMSKRYEWVNFSWNREKQN